MTVGPVGGVVAPPIRPEVEWGVTISPAARTYNTRRGRMRSGRVDTTARLLPRFGLSEGPLDRVFGRHAPLVLEIGSGMGEATVTMAAADPGRDYLAVEVHTAGVANLLGLIEATGLTNVRTYHGDALALLRDRLAPGSLDAIHVFFPDPWPKTRHRKRRLIQAARVPLLIDRLRPGGVLHCATDDAEYALHMLRVLGAASGLANVHSGFAPRPAYRPETRYERRGELAGRPAHDLVFRRLPGSHDRVGTS